MNKNVDNIQLSQNDASSINKVTTSNHKQRCRSRKRRKKIAMQRTESDVWYASRIDNTLQMLQRVQAIKETVQQTYDKKSQPTAIDSLRLSNAIDNIKDIQRSLSTLEHKRNGLQTIEFRLKKRK